jgi:hypothetical protein
LNAVNSFECITGVAIAVAARLIFQNLFFLCHRLFLFKKKMRKKNRKIQQKSTNFCQYFTSSLIDRIGLDWIRIGLDWIGLD